MQGQGAGMGFVRSLLTGRNSVFLAGVAGAAFVGDIAADYFIDAAWRWNNRGVRYSKEVMGDYFVEIVGGC